MASNDMASQLEKGLEISPSSMNHICTDTSATLTEGVPLSVRCMDNLSMPFHKLTILSHVEVYSIASTSSVDSLAMDPAQRPGIASSWAYGIHKGTKT